MIPNVRKGEGKMERKIQDIEDAIYLLQKKKETTFVSIRGTERYVSSKIGIEPLLDRLTVDKYSFADGVVADKQIDKAKAMILVKSQVREVYAKLISEPALEYFGEYHVRCLFAGRVPSFGEAENCFESEVMDTDDYNEAYNRMLAHYNNGEFVPTRKRRTSR